MKIQKLEFGDRARSWYLEEIEFSPHLNLLVGVSGAGKTKIISSILYLKEIVNGKSFNGMYWDVTFLTKDNISYRWQGEFETVKGLRIRRNDSDEEYKLKIISEHISKDKQIIIERDSEKIIFKGSQIPKLSPFQSIVELFNQEEDISPVKDEFNKIITNSDKSFENLLKIPTHILEKYQNCSLNDLKESNISIFMKFCLAYQFLPETFNKIKDTFVELFHTVEDIKIGHQFINYGLSEPPIDSLLGGSIVYIKERGVERWIKPNTISSGMLKTLMYISEFYLSPEGSVILIDEFENSLGVNCLDSVTDLILENPRLQFIITSHHPYIINNIGNKYWKIVTRQGNTVTVKEPKELGLAQSTHQGFIDLINFLEELSEEGEAE
ncbi:MAG: AAA family ATPase [Okeania sp. SIO3I5]|uniref:ATP-binding protein n=1 Tax=Okeania sp. SIO3I5 TaxID=2607805 RepID=UPI0013B70845|nr:ATP-binding protein [Okeania sp. SIO3I5]NEQ41646.1 AAA family ATPase [Okeania sp. SIO3I5]